MMQAEGELLHEYALKFNSMTQMSQGKVRMFLLKALLWWRVAKTYLTRLNLAILDLDLFKKWGVYTTVVMINNRTKVI